MPNNTDNALRAAIRSMNEVIVPSINPVDPLAKEQAQLIIQLLQFLRARAPYLQQRDRAELVIHRNIVSGLMEEIALILPDRLEKTQAELSEAESASINPFPAPEDLSRLADSLRTLLSDLVRAAAREPEDVRTKIESAVIQGSKQILELQQAWFLPTGMVPGGDRLPDLEHLLQV